jgi:hypothetical protein
LRLAEIYIKRTPVGAGSGRKRGRERERELADSLIIVCCQIRE